VILEALVCKFICLYKIDELNLHGTYNVRMHLVTLHGFNIYIKDVSKLVSYRRYLGTIGSDRYIVSYKNRVKLRH